MKLLIYRSCSGWAMELVVYIILLTCNLLLFVTVVCKVDSCLFRTAWFRHVL